MPLYLRYYFWLLVVSVFVFALERIYSRTPKQPVFREGFNQDLFWLVFNTQYASWMLAILSVHTAAWVNARFLQWGFPSLDSIRLISTWPLAFQFVAFFLAKDLLEWGLHRGMHRVSWLWEIHKLHHSSERLDWLASFRAHWGEIVLYQFTVYLPLVLLGVNEGVVFSIVILSLVMQELVHANLNWDWGPLRYVINSPRLHAWHHSVEMHAADGQNFGTSLSIWDCLFKTVYWPRDGAAPAQLGFEGMQEYPSTVWGRFWAPFNRRRRLVDKVIQTGR